MKKQNWAWAILITLLTFVLLSTAQAEQKSSKYKLQTLKMEFIGTTLTSTVSTTTTIKVPTTTSTTIPTKEVSFSQKALFVICDKDFHDLEFSKPKELLEANGVKVEVASTTTDFAVGMRGLRVKPDLLIADARVADYTAVVFIGGNGAVALVKNPSAQKLALQAYKKKKIVGAICISPLVLAEAGILKNKKATVSPYGVNDLRKAGGIYTDVNVEIDGKIITGKGPAASEEFGKTLLKALQTP